MAYKYTFMSEIQTVVLGMRDLTSEEFNEKLSEGLGKVGDDVTKSMESLEGGPWEAVSHSLTRFENHLIVTVLIRHELPHTS